MKVVGIDFDNTLVNYDQIFSSEMTRLGIVKKGMESSKEALKRHFEAQGDGNLLWTRMQSEIYCRRLHESSIAEGALDAIRAILESGVAVRIISHKTQYPTVGFAVDLHHCAKRWINDFVIGRLSKLNNTSIKWIFCPTVDEKWECVEQEGCDWFIDDLHSFLSDSRFPKDTTRVWYTNKVSSSQEFQAFSKWTDIAQYILSERSIGLKNLLRSDASPTYVSDFSMEPEPILQNVLKEELGLSLLGVERLEGGVNNQVFKLLCKGSVTLCGKIYKRTLGDPRDRMNHEIQFLRFLNKNKVSSVPQLLATDSIHGVSIMSFIDGLRWKENTKVPNMIWRQFAFFFDKLQSLRSCQGSESLPRAAEGARSLQEHLGHLHKKRDNWLKQAIHRKLDYDLEKYVLEELETEYQEVAELTISHSDFKKVFDEANVIISPSDFGLHNALVDKQNKVWFIDFEYAGWDDPVKAMIDFSAQPRYLPAKDFQLLQLEKTSVFDCVRRILQLKWKYIILANEVRKRA